MGKLMIRRKVVITTGIMLVFGCWAAVVGLAPQGPLVMNVALSAMKLAPARTVGGGPPPLPMPGGSHGYFNSLVARTDFWKGFSGRPVPGQPITSVHYEKQLLQRSLGGYAQERPLSVTFDPANDTDPQKQDAAKIVIPKWFANGTLIDAMNASQETLNTNSTHRGYSDRSRDLRIDDEVLTITAKQSGATVGVSRGQHDTRRASHAAGTQIYMSINNLPNQLNFPLHTSSGNVYLFTWDEYPTDSVFRVNEVTNKVWQFRDRGRGRHPQIWYEHRHKTSVRGSGFNPAIHAFSIDMRKYSPAQQPIAPQVGFCNSKPRQWIRYWTRIKHDDVSGSKASTWVATEDQDPTLIVDETDVAVRGGSIELFNVEFNHSFDDFCGGPIFEDQVYYFRNFAALLNPPADISSLLVKPVP